MSSYSTWVTLAWQIAALEASQAHSKFIEKEQVLIGLLKVGDLLESKFHVPGELQVSPEELELLGEEITPIEMILDHHGLKRVSLRRTIRGIVGMGDYTHDEKVVHRSEGCKKVFTRAEEMAAKGGGTTVRLLHLLRAIFENPGDIIERALSKFGVDKKAFGDDIRFIRDGKEGVTAFNGKDGEMGENQSATPFLDRLGVDLTSLAAEGKIDPLIGRRQELLKMTRTLTRKTKNNPLLIGEAGVGKTAIVRGLALRIAQGNITPALRGKRIVELNMANLVAGTKYRGEFEEKIRKVLEEVKNCDDVIIFIDELHTIVGAGNAEGGLDASNIMKPIFSKGEIKCIGATTIAEYRKYFEKDAALERRFQPIMIEEPSGDETLDILEGLKERFEKHHRVHIAPSALDAGVALAIRYLPDRRLPDKAIDLIDEACSRVRIDSLSFHGKIEDIEVKVGRVTEEIVADVVAEWTGQPVRAPGNEERKRLSSIQDELQKRVIGQEGAVERVSQVIKMARMGLRDPRRPIGVFLFLGPTGVGKTELAKALSEFLFGAEDHMIRLDMSEYMEKTNVARLIGAPPGYVGYDDEGQLTGKLRSHPYSVVLLDEIEKAHPDVLDIFLQLFDEGRLTDSKGRVVSAKSAIFVMTSNIGGEQYQKRPLGFGARQQEEQAEAVMAQLTRKLKPEFMGRIDEVIVFGNLEDDDIKKITLLEIEKIKTRLTEQKIRLEVTDEAVMLLSTEGFDHNLGVRPLRRTIERLISRMIAEKLLSGEIIAGDNVRIDVIGGTIAIVKKGEGTAV